MDGKPGQDYTPQQALVSCLGLVPAGGAKVESGRVECRNGGRKESRVGWMTPVRPTGEVSPTQPFTKVRRGHEDQQRHDSTSTPLTPSSPPCPHHQHRCHGTRVQLPSGCFSRSTLAPAPRSPTRASLYRTHLSPPTQTTTRPSKNSTNEEQTGNCHCKATSSRSRLAR